MTRVRPASSRAAPALVVAFVVLAFFGLNLRLAIAAVSPLLPDIRAEYGLSAPAGGLATTLAVLMFGIVSPLAPRLLSRYSPHHLLTAGLVVACAGVLVRSVPGAVAFYLGMAVLGAGIALMNVVLPVIVKRDFPRHVAAATAVYAAALNIGSAAAASSVVPLSRTLDGWRPALALVGVPMLAALILSWVFGPRRGRVSLARVRFITLLRSPIALQVTAYMMLQSLLYYVLLAWLPTIYADHGESAVWAGIMLGVTQVAQLVACLVVPLISRHLRDQRVAAAGFALVTAVAYAGLAIAPVGAPVLWAILLGLGQGGALTISLMLIVQRSSDHGTAAALSAFSQSAGYTLAAFGPFLIGLLHEFLGGWDIALMIITGVCLVEVGIGWLAGRDIPTGSSEFRRRKPTRSVP